MLNDNITEARLQSECYQWFHNTYPEQRGLLFMVHNTPKNKIDGARLKAMGMVAGVSDLVYLTPQPPLGYGAVMIEIKLPGQKQSQPQIDWELQVDSAGYKYFVVDNIDDFKRLISKLRYNKLGL